MIDESESFRASRLENISKLGHDKDLQAFSRIWQQQAARHNYIYNFTWLDRPIIQLPPDIIAIQELVWSVKPDLIIETGVAHGGSLILSASLLTMLEYADAVNSDRTVDPTRPERKVLGIDIDIRQHNREAIESHVLSSRIEMIEGSSIDPEIIARVHKRAQQADRVMVCLDSNHTHDHVLAELEAYASLVTTSSYCIVFDTAIEDVSNELFDDRPWGHGNNPKTAVWEFLKTHTEFEIDKSIQHKLLVTVAPDGYLKRVR